MQMIYSLLLPNCSWRTANRTFSFTTWRPLSKLTGEEALRRNELWSICSTPRFPDAPAPELVEALSIPPEAGFDWCSLAD